MFFSDAVNHIQRHAVAEDEVDRAGDLDVFFFCYERERRVGGNVVPAVLPFPERVVFAQLGVAREGAGLPDRFAVCKLIVYVVHGVRAPRDHVLTPGSYCVARPRGGSHIPVQALRGIRIITAVNVQIARDGEAAVVAVAAAAADAHGVCAAVCGDRAAGDRDIDAGAVFAAADARAAGAAGRGDRSAADADESAAGTTAAAADARAAVSAAAAGRGDRAAGDGDLAALAASAAADARAAGSVAAAVCFDRAAADGDLAAGAASAAADASTAVCAAAGRGDTAAVDGDLAAGAAGAAADARAV